MFRRSFTLSAALFVALLASSSASSAAAQARPIDGVRVDVHGDIGHWGALGAGFRVDIPIVPDGFLHASSVKDELALSPGLDLYFWRSTYDYWDNGCRCWVSGGGADYVSFWPTITAQWNFYLTRADWSFMGEAGLVMGINDDRYWNRGAGRGFWLMFAAGAGARYHFNERNALLMRIMWPGGFQIGITF